MSEVTLSQREAKVLVSYLEHFSDRLAKEHAEEHSGVGQLLLITAIQDIDLLAVNLKEQLEQVVESEPAYAIQVEA